MLTSLSAKSMVLLERGIVKGDCIPHSARNHSFDGPCRGGIHAILRPDNQFAQSDGGDSR